MKLLSTFCFLLFTITSYAQIDTLMMHNGDFIVGDIKKLDKGVVEIETDYSDSNFKIEWEGIKYFICNTKFSITLSSGDRFYGKISTDSTGTFRITTNDNKPIPLNPKDIVYLKSVNESFIDKLSASIDVGYNFTKANNLSQLNTAIFMAYNSNRWIVTFSINSLRSTQENVQAIVRDEGTLSANYFLPKDYYFTGGISYLTNTEQSINLRTITSGGLGKYILHTNKAYWGISTGVSMMTESFDPIKDNDGNVTQKSSNASSEWYLGTDINLFDIGDLALNATGKGFRTLSDNKRWRVDAGVNLKYKLPYDFYIKSGYKMNYDNQPIEEGKELDYQYTFGFGWEL